MALALLGAACCGIPRHVMHILPDLQESMVLAASREIDPSVSALPSLDRFQGTLGKSRLQDRGAGHGYDDLRDSRNGALLASGGLFSHHPGWGGTGARRYLLDEGQGLDCARIRDPSEALDLRSSIKALPEFESLDGQEPSLHRRRYAVLKSAEIPLESCDSALHPVGRSPSFAAGFRVTRLHEFLCEPAGTDERIFQLVFEVGDGLCGPQLGHESPLECVE